MDSFPLLVLAFVNRPGPVEPAQNMVSVHLLKKHGGDLSMFFQVVETEYNPMPLQQALPLPLWK